MKKELLIYLVKPLTKTIDKRVIPVLRGDASFPTAEERPCTGRQVGAVRV